MYLENLTIRDFYVMSYNEVLAYLEYVHFSKTLKHFDEDVEDGDKDWTQEDIVYDYGISGGEILPCNDDVFDFWHIIPYHEAYAYSVDRIRKGGLFIAESLIYPKQVFGEKWLKLHRYEFKYRLSE